jgi:hypothetical protein
MGSGLDDWIYWRLLCTVSLHYNQYSAIADLHNFQFTVAHAIGFSVSTSRIRATGLDTGTITSNHYEVFLPFFIPSSWTDDSPELDPVQSFESHLAESESESYITTDGQSNSLSWNKHLSGAYD